jgi:uncharacterized metal-binding protein YceD (DUF177 family)
MTDPVTTDSGIAQTWVHLTTDIPSRGTDVQRKAMPEECALLAKELDIPAVERLEVRYNIKPLSGGRYRLEGTLKADVVQACIVTLDPVRSVVDDRIEVEFRSDVVHEPQGKLGEELIVLEVTEYEPLEHGRVDVGRIVTESLAAALPAYPRSPGAALEQIEAGPPEPGPASPFSALAGWKPKKEE